MQLFGIDVSAHQGNFDFAKAKEEGVTFAILKAGGGDVGRYKDSKFETYYAACKSLGIPVGAYFFGRELTVEDAKKSADYFVSLLKGKQFEYPVYYDVEATMLKLNKTLLNQIVDAFCSTVQSAGYYTGIYASASPFSTTLTDTKFTHWVASYGSLKPSTRNLDIWQYGGEINKIRSNIVAGVVCDQDYCYKDFPTIIKQKGLNGFNKNDNTPSDNNVTPSDNTPSNDGDKPLASGTVMTNTTYVNKLLEIVNLPTVYSNKYPRNLGYWDGSKFSFDCWNLIKAVINGWYPNYTVGYYQKNLSITGDIDGLGILNKCTYKSKDFTQLKIPGTYLFIRNSHAGTYVGEYNIGGYIVNTIECTSAWSKNVLWSYTDEKGRRLKYKGGPQCSAWTDWGLMCWVDYQDTDVNPTPTPLPVNKPSVAQPTLSLGMKGTQVKLLQQDLEYLGFSVGKAGCDGDFGGDTKKALIAFQSSKYGFPITDDMTDKQKETMKKEWDGVYGKKSAEKMKNALS